MTKLAQALKKRRTSTDWSEAMSVGEFIFAYTAGVIVTGATMIYLNDDEPTPSWLKLVNMVLVILWPVYWLLFIAGIFIDLKDKNHQKSNDFVIQNGSPEWPAAQKALREYFEWRGRDGHDVTE